MTCEKTAEKSKLRILKYAEFKANGNPCTVFADAARSLAEEREKQPVDPIQAKMRADWAIVAAQEVASAFAAKD